MSGPSDDGVQGRPDLFRVVLPVADIDVAVRFYARLLGTAGERVSAGRHYFRCGAVILACVDPPRDGHGEYARPNEGHVFLAVADLDRWFERAREAGCSWLDDAPRLRSWGERSFYARDPSGNPLCFVDRETTYLGPGGGPQRGARP